jgi:hypothetical protein
MLGFFSVAHPPPTSAKDETVIVEIVSVNQIGAIVTSRVL